MAERRQIDRKKAEAFIKHMSEQVTAGFNCSLSHVGNQLGLYRTIDEIGPVTSVGLAEHTGYHERWLREWLRHQACVRQVEYLAADDAFYLSPEAAAVLCDADHPLFFAPGFDAVAATHASVPKLADAFKTGLGLTYDAHGAACACGIERMNTYFLKNEFVQNVLPKLDGVTEKLQIGGLATDVGCGAGVATLQMAAAFPDSHFVGFDTSDHALERARENLREAGLSNVEFKNPLTDPMPADGTFDFACTLDVVHDTPYPDRLIGDIRAALADDGTWLCSDIRSFDSFEQNLEEHPSAAMFYGFSLMICMSSSMSTPDGAGLGTLGFNEEVAKTMTSAAGFSRFGKIEYETAVNSYYEVRP